MKAGFMKYVLCAAIAALVVVGGSATARGEEAPPPCTITSPTYTPDFSANQSCLTPNGAQAGNSNSAYPKFLANSDGGPIVLRLTPNANFWSASAWFNTPQSIAGGFSTSFQFQMSNQSVPPADGIAFVIQNSSDKTAALDTGGSNDGCSIGFGGSSTGCTSGPGISNSVAVEFDTYQNADDPNNNHIAIQSCGTSPNSIDSGPCRIADNSTLLDGKGHTITLADGNIHTVTISYTPPPSGSGPGTLDVILDNTDLFPKTPDNPSGGVAFDMTSIGLADGGTAYVGFTGATGGSFENQDILSWTFTPQAQSGTVQQGQETDLNFEGGFSPQTQGYDANAQLTQGNPVVVQVNPIVVQNQQDCDTLVQKTFPGAHCFVYDNANGTGTTGSVLFEYTCPGSDTGGQCGIDGNADFFATLGTDFFFEYENNPGFPMPAMPPANYEPLAGWLKGVGSNPLAPCANADGKLTFQSNQIVSFEVLPGEPPAKSKGSSGGTGSCWVETYSTPGEAPSVNVTQPANNGTYQQGQTALANYTCTTVNEGINNPTGPYLTPTSCTATDIPGGAVANGAQFDTSTLGPHTFTATVVDSATNRVSQTVTYNVVGSADLAIANVARTSAPTGGNLTYLIGVGDLGGANGVNVTVSDTLAPGTSFVSASGSDVACAIVNKRLSCTTTPVNCTYSSGAVSCNVGTIMPLSLSSLNGAVIQITAKVIAPAGTSKNPVVVSNTAAVSASNADPKLGNNSSTANTTVTAH